MIDRIIEFSAQNKFLVFLFVAAASLAGWWSMNRIPLDAIPDLSDTQVIVYSRWDRSPDIMEDQVTYPIVTRDAGRAEGERRARLLRLRLLVRLHHLRRRHRHLLGALAHARISVEDSAAAAARRADGARAGCDRRRLGVSVRAGRYSGQAQPGGAALASRTGSCATSCRRCPGVAEVAPLGGFVRQYQVNVDPNRLQAYNIPIAKVVEAVRARQQRRRRAAGGDSRARVHGARARLRASRRTTWSSIVLAASASGRAGARAGRRRV